MLFAVTGLLGCSVEASDGRVGAVEDFLFDDRSWKIRWVVVDVGHWLSGRRVLIHPSAIAPLELAEPSRLPMMSGSEAPVLFVRLTKQEIEAGPDASVDEPVTQKTQERFYEHYGWDPLWGDALLGPDALLAEIVADQETNAAPVPDGDPHLGSVDSVKGYAVHATDGDIGHVETFLADDGDWNIRYLVIATHDWWPGKHVQLAPYAVTDIDWVSEQVDVNVTREQVKASPPWDPLALADEIARQQYHRHFGWPG